MLGDGEEEWKTQMHNLKKEEMATLGEHRAGGEEEGGVIGSYHPGCTKDSPAGVSHMLGSGRRVKAPSPQHGVHAGARKHAQMVCQL